MNDKLLEFAIQSGVVESNVDWEKFAELIVKECASHILTSSDRHRREYFAESLLEHFGVE